MPKGKRGRATRSRASAPPVRASRPARTGIDQEQLRLPDWRWRSFPVLCAFVSGMLVAFLANGATSNPAAFVLLIAALLGFGYCLAHLVVTNVFLAGRVRRRRAALERGEVPAEDYEDELVYKDEA